MQHDMNDGNALQATMTEAALYVSRWAAAKAGATVSLWSTMPRRVNRYFEEMVSAYSQTAPLEVLRAWWCEPGDHHLTIGGRLMR